MKARHPRPGQPRKSRREAGGRKLQYRRKGLVLCPAL